MNDDLSRRRETTDEHLTRVRRQIDNAPTRHAALETAIQAAEASMAALKLAKNAADKSHHSAAFKSFLREAERVKHSDDWRRSPGSTLVSGPSRVLKEPASTRVLTRAEQIILLKASYLNGFKFPPWTEPPSSEEFQSRVGEPLFSEAMELPLSEFQEEVLLGWKRPGEALPPPTWFPDSLPDTGPTFTATAKIDLVQDAATDCSVVASLCAGVSRVERGHAPILPRIIYPSDAASDTLLESASGKYILKLNFNGCYRKVVIDDFLPVSKTSRVIHVVDRQNPGLLWPALIEKAYLKVRGGYDFPGSNSGTDLWILTGWIPEQVFLQSDDLEPDRLWKRMSVAHAHGDILITMGTGKMSEQTEKEIGLASEHDYAVLDLREVDGQRLMLVKNPWFEGTSWNGRFQHSLRSKSADHVEPETSEVECSRDLLNADDELSPGKFWMDLDNVIQHFESIYLNWNSGLFGFRQDAHFTWNLAVTSSNPGRPRGRYASLTHNPQYTVTASKAGTIWVLLSRHFRNAISATATDEEIESGKYNIDLNGHIALMAFSVHGRRVLLSERYLQKGWLVDSPQSLLKLEDCEPGLPYTIVPIEQDLDAAEHNFTLAIFSNSAIVLSEAMPRFPCRTTVTAAWTRDTAGGNAHNAAYGINPQFTLDVPNTTSISILLETLNDELNVHVKLVNGKGERVYTVRKRDIVFDSKDYRHGCCVAEHSELDAGRYTIICSTFEPQQLGEFTLTVESGRAVQIASVPKEGAGRVRTELRPVTFSAGHKTMAIPIHPQRLVNLYAIARHAHTARTLAASDRSPMRVTIQIGRGDHRQILSESNHGEYGEMAAGIRTTQADFRPNSHSLNDLWLVVDRSPAGSGAHDETVSIEILADRPESVVFGEWRVWEND